MRHHLRALIEGNPLVFSAKLYDAYFGNVKGGVAPSPPPPPVPSRMAKRRWLIIIRAGRVRELMTSSRSKFKMAWHQFSTVQFTSDQFV